MEHQEQVKEQEHQLIQQKSTPNTNSGLSKESVPLQFKSNSFAPPLQRKENTNFNIAQLFANKNGSENTSIQMKSTKGNLPEAVQTKMESSMGADFSGVNIQTNSKSAQDVGALAYTQGSDVHFAPGQFKPDTKGGQELIGHELAHVIQQKAGRVKANKSVGNMPVNDNTSLEKEADVAGAKAAAGKPFSVAGSGGGIQMKAAPIQGFFGKSTKLKSEADVDAYIETKYKELVYDRIVGSKDLRQALGGAIRRWKTFGFKTTKNKELRDSTKAAARGEFNKAIDKQQNTSGKGDAMYGLAQDRAKVDAYKESKGIVEDEITNTLIELVNTKGNFGKRLGAKKLKDNFNAGMNNSEMKNILKNFYESLRTSIKNKALADIAANRHPVTKQDLKAESVKKVKNRDYDTRAKELIKDKLEAPNVGRGMQLIGEIINSAVPTSGTEASLEIELTIPIASFWGGVNAFLTITFGGEASREEDSSGKQEIGSKAKLTFGAKAEVAKFLEFGIGIGGYIEAQAQDIDKLMSLYSYGGYRLANGISKKLGGALWGYGGKTGKSSIEEAARFGDAMEEDTMMGAANEDNFVEIGAHGEAKGGGNIGIGKLEAGLEIGGGRRYDKDTVGRNAGGRNDGKKTFFASLEGELELGLEKLEGFGTSVGISASFKRVRDLMEGTTIKEAGANEWEFVVSGKLSTGFGASKNINVDKIIRWISAIAGPATTWANAFVSKAKQGAAQKVGVGLNTISDASMITPLLSSQAESFAEGVVAKMGQEQSDVYGGMNDEGVWEGDMDDNLQSNVSIGLEATITHDSDGWNINLVIKETKENSINTGIVKGTKEQSRKLFEIGSNDGGYVKAPGVNKKFKP